MTRSARTDILYDGCYAHVFSRSVDSKRVFAEPPDFDTAMSLLLEAKNAHPFRIHHYCFMHTHFHLAVSIPSLNDFSKAIQKFKWAYTTYFNRKYTRRGPLWQSRFKSLVIENEQYLHACGLYIESNPVQAALAQDVTDWPYSSARFYMLGRHDGLLDPYELAPLPDGIEITDAANFTKGYGIGSRLLKIQLKDGFLCHAP